MAERKRFEYVILVDGKEVWRGLNPKKEFDRIKEENPGKKVGIAWEPGEGILIA
ncbi:MAG: hypothetical protein AB1779_10500 [Candidatus Thermoplasmatota archaeon]